MKRKKKSTTPKMNAHGSEDEYLEKLQEWQEHQYDPGFYTGGNIPPVLTHPGKPFILGWFYVITSILACVLIIWLVSRSFDIEQIFPITIAILMVFGFCTIQFIAGIRLIKKVRLQNKGKVLNKKPIIIAGIIICALVLFLLGIYQINNHYDEIIITSIDQVELKQVYEDNFVYIKTIDRTLSCNIYDYDFLYYPKIGIGPQHTTFKIEFVWNSFNPKQGKITKILR